jgi:hypothetical protein
MSIVCKSRCGEFERCQFYGLMSDMSESAAIVKPFFLDPLPQKGCLRIHYVRPKRRISFWEAS